MSDLKKQLDKEYLVKDIFKLIMESNEPGERGSAIPAPVWSKEEQSQNFYQVAIDKYTSAPSVQDVKNFKNPDRFNNVFGFNKDDDIRARIQKINSVYMKSENKGATIPAVLNTLETLSTFYKVINHYDDKTAGVLMENLIAILTGGKIPSGDPIEDVVVTVDTQNADNTITQTLVKAYSLKTLSEFRPIEGSFANLIKFFYDNPQIEYISYLFFKKESPDKKSPVTSLKVYEKKYTLNLSGESSHGHKMYNIFGELTKNNFNKLFSTIHIKQQRYIYVEKELGADLLNRLGIQKEEQLVFSEEELEAEIKDLSSKAVRQGTGSREEGFNNLNTFLKNYRKEEYNTTTLIVDLQKIKINPEDKKASDNIRRFLSGEDIKGYTRVETKFNFSSENFIKNENEEFVGEIKISLDSFYGIINQNADMLGNIVHETYRTLNALDNSINSFFKEPLRHETHKTQSIKYANDMVKQVSRFKEIQDSDLNNTTKRPIKLYPGS